MAPPTISCATKVPRQMGIMLRKTFTLPQGFAVRPKAFQQRIGMPQRGIVRHIGANQTCDFTCPSNLVQWTDMCARVFVIFNFLDYEVMMTSGRDLSRVGDA